MWLRISSGDILFMMTLGWVVRVVSIWAALGGGPVCILAIEFSFTEIGWLEFLGEGAARFMG